MSGDDDRCPQCGLPWDRHPYDQFIDDFVCRKVKTEIVVKKA